MRRHSPRILLLVLLAVEFPGSVLAQGVVMTPNCFEPLDSITVRSGGWPKQGAFTLAHSPGFPGGPLSSISIFRTSGSVVEWTMYNGGKAFIYKDESWWHGDESEIGDYYLRVYQGQIGAPGTRCIWIPYRVVVSVSNPWSPDPKPCKHPGTPGCLPVIEMHFDPSQWCNTAPCRKIRFVQAYRDSGVCGSGCYRILTNAEQGLRDGVSRDATTVAGWTIDAIGDDPTTPQDDRDQDPYMNGNDASDFWFHRARVGSQGIGSPAESFVKDQPGVAFPTDITEIVSTFEADAFCSDGPIQGEWLGRLAWRWTKPRGGPASITVLSMANEKPSQQFMDALRGWCQVRGFDWPRDDAIPTTGGTTCP